MLRVLLVVLALQQPRSDSLIRVAADTTTSLYDRALALRMLGRTCSRDMIPVLTKLGDPYRGQWILWHGALEALSHCPYEELASFWRELLTFPREPVREIAIVGLLRTGEPGDIPLIRDATHRETDPAIMRWAAVADSVLRLPVAERGGLLPR